MVNFPSLIIDTIQIHTKTNCKMMYQM